MKCTIKETGQVKELFYMWSGVNTVSGLLGNQGALSDGQFTYDYNSETYAVSKEDFEWWDDKISEYIDAEGALSEFIEEYDGEIEDIRDYILQKCDVEFNDIPGCILDEIEKLKGGD